MGGEETDGGTFESAGVRLAYDDVGGGPPVVLVHGLASDRHTNWRRPGWYDALTEAGRRVVALDSRGHGDSDKPHESAAYGIETMAADVTRLLDHLSLPEADVIGYSMGARIAVTLLLDHADRVNAAVLGGVGAEGVSSPPAQDAIVAALEAADPSTIDHPAGRQIRAFADRQGGDRRALAAAMDAASGVALEALTAVTAPVLVVAGADDRLAGEPRPLAAAIPNATAVVVPDRAHNTTVGDPRFRAAAVDFLDRHGLGDGRAAGTGTND